MGLIATVGLKKHKVNVPKGYRFLDVRERAQDGDMFCNCVTLKWQKVEKMDIGERSRFYDAIIRRV